MRSERRARRRSKARLAAAIATLLALVAGMSACGARRAAEAPATARVSITAAMRVHPCRNAVPRRVPVRLAVVLTGQGRRRALRLTTGAQGTATVRLTPGRYAVAPARRSLRPVVSVRFDGSPIAPRRGVWTIRVGRGGRHRLLLVLRLRPGECNGLQATG